MRKSIHSEEYQLVLTTLVTLRKKAGLTQRDLAKKLEREHSFVWRIETGERRLDVIEFHWVCQALGQNAAEVYRQLIRAVDNINQYESPSSTSIPKAAEPKTMYRAKNK